MKKNLLIGFTIVLAAGVMLAGWVGPGPAFAEKLRISVSQEPTEMDIALASSGPTYSVVENWSEWLIQQTPKGDFVPGLATEWKWSPDYKQITFTLRKGVKFHSGDAFTAKDVAFSYTRGLAKNRIVKIRLRSFEKVEVIDDYHVKVYFKSPDATFIQSRGAVGIVSKAYYDRVGEEEFLKKPVGTGPYKMVKYVTGQYVDIERNEDYWGPKPSVKEARFSFDPEDTTRVAKLQAGEVDMIQNVPWALVKNLEKDKRFKLETIPTNHPTRGIIFATRNPNVPWHDPKVRLAMAHAIDRQAIIHDLLNDVPHTYGFIAPNQIGYDPAVKPWSYDPALAKKLLAEAGYPNGFEMNFYWSQSGRVPMASETVQTVGAMLGAVGIKCKLIGEEYSTFRKRRSAAKKPDANFVAFYSGSLTGERYPANALGLYFSSRGPFSSYSNPAIDKLARQVKSEMDPPKQAELIKKAVKIMYEDVPTIPLYHAVAVFAMKKNIDFKYINDNIFDFIYVKNITVN